MVRGGTTFDTVVVTAASKGRHPGLLLDRSCSAGHSPGPGLMMSGGGRNVQLILLGGGLLLLQREVVLALGLFVGLLHLQHLDFVVALLVGLVRLEGGNLRRVVRPEGRAIIDTDGPGLLLLVADFLLLVLRIKLPLRILHRILFVSSVAR